MIRYIDKYGTPDALFFSFEENKYYAIWGFDEIYTISNDQINDSNILCELQNKINEWKSKSSKNEIATVGFLSYDSKGIFFPKINFKPINSNGPLLWFGKPSIVKKIERDDLINLEYPKAFLNQINSVSGSLNYHKKINTIKNYLESGDVYQINYTQPMHYNSSCDSFYLYLSLMKSANPTFGAYLNLESTQYISMSPENFFTKKGKSISSSPIKGTRMRSSAKKVDEALKLELKNSQKDRAEHVMIVDLIRNDLGKICEFGSINTENLFDIKSFNTIHHMVTDITGNLKNDISEIDIFKALFPGGSITGAPKQRAMEIIDQIENYSRGIYTGSMGLITDSGDMIFNIAIRTLTLKNDKIEYPVGGGIVWDSKPDEERLESIQKSKILDI